VPIYDYTCGACQRVTEVIHGINDQGPRFCPSCGAEGTMRKALTAPAIVFKGSGWAKVDRRSAGSSSGSSGSRRAGGKSGSSASGTGAGSSGDGSGSSGGGSGSSAPPGGSSATAAPSDGGGD
jgi:putative FmdB family regulatory protein